MGVWWMICAIVNALGTDHALKKGRPGLALLSAITCVAYVVLWFGEVS